MKGWNRSTISGFICCFAMVIVGIVSNGGIGTIAGLIHIPSMIITFGGAIFAVLITSESFADFKDGLHSFRIAFSKENQDLDEIGDVIYQLALVARKEGMLVLEEKVETVENPFLAKGVRLIVDGTDPELLKDILETDLLHEMEDNARRVTFWENMGGYAPAWGMLGTLLGLINMMKGMGEDPSQIGAGMSLALLTTLYGSLLANWICIPVAAKLRRSGAAKQLEKELIVEGILSIQAGDNPMVIKEKIRTFRADWEEKTATEAGNTT